MNDLSYIKYNYYQPNCPIFVIGYFIRKEVESVGKPSQKKIAIAFQNISDQNIRAFSGRVKSKDVFKEQLTAISFEMIELDDFYGGEFIGENTFIEVHQNLESLEIIIDKVVFINGESINLSDQKSIEINDSTDLDPALEKYHRYVFNKHNKVFQYKNTFSQLEGAYLCSCGNLNFIENKHCCYCKVEKKKINQPLDISIINNEIDELTSDFIHSFDFDLLKNLTIEKANKYLVEKQIPFSEFIFKVKEKFEDYDDLDDLLKAKIDLNLDINFSELFKNFISFTMKYNKHIRRTKLFKRSLLVLLFAILLYFSLDILSTLSYKEDQIEYFITDVETKILYDEIDNYYDSRYAKYSLINRKRFNLIRTFSEERNELEKSFDEQIISTRINEENYNSIMSRYDDDLEKYKRLIQHNENLIDTCNENCDIKIPIYQRIIRNYQFIIDNQNQYLKTMYALFNLKHLGQYSHSESENYFQINEDTASYRMNYIKPTFNESFDHFVMLMNGDYITVEEAESYFLNGKILNAVRQFNINSEYGSPIIKFYNFNDNQSYDLTSNDYVFSIGIKNGFTISNYNGNSQEISIPNYISGVPVTRIGNNAFNNKKLTHIIIPNLVTSIGDGAFSNNQLSNITIPALVKSIGDNTFSNNQLTNIIIPDNVTNIGNYAFSNNQLTSINISDNITFIGNYAFSNNQLTNINIPDNFISIGNSVFSNNKLISVTIPNSVVVIGFEAFSSNNLTSITIPNSVISIGNRAFSNNNLSSIIIPVNVTSIGNSAFSNNSFFRIEIRGDRLRFNENWEDIGFPLYLKPTNN